MIKDYIINEEFNTQNLNLFKIGLWYHNLCKFFNIPLRYFILKSQFTSIKSLKLLNKKKNPKLKLKEKS